ncbi:hypothetical protein PHMEG_00027666 [Phytophthora megakarya]|uniref:Uncharacterized protein n=1 Tax=Phytophthora megakarya TaxID=4795 RepID=A0A225V6N5_9STRA|nr:hypothetical protein PHMEG_00027666 [Phytophthora megakarya]
MRENLEKGLADDDFMLGLTAEGLVAGNMDSAPSQKVPPVTVTTLLQGEDTVVEVPVEAGAPVDDAPVSESSVSGASGLGPVHSPSPLPPVPKPGSAVPISQLLNDVSIDLAELETSDSPPKDAETIAADGVTESSVPRLASDSVVAPTTPVVSSAPGSAVSPNITVVSARTRARSQRAAGVPTQPAIPRHVPGVGMQGGSRPRRKTHVVPATVTARRGSATSAFVPAATVVFRVANAQNLTATAERFLEPGFAAVGAQKAWCQMLNVSISESAPKDHASPLDFAFVALMYNVHSARHPWRVLFDRMLDEPLTFELGKLVQGNSDPLDPFTHVILGLWYHLNRMRNNRADLLRQQIDWLSHSHAATEVSLEPSYLQYSTEVLEWAPDTTDWFRELRVLDAKQPWRNCWIDAPADHPYNTTYAPCNPSGPLLVPTSMTRHAVISITTAPSVAEICEGSPAKTAKEGSVDIEGASSAPVETVEALDEDSFSFVHAEAAASGSDSEAAESSATPTGVEAPAHDVEEPPSDIVLAPFEMLVQNATSERLASE